MPTTRRIDSFDAINMLLLTVISAAFLYPLWFTIAASISDAKLVAIGAVRLLPKGLNVDAYAAVFGADEVWTGYANSVIYTGLGTAINLFVTISCAFALARKRMIGRNLLMGVFVFTMYFDGGLIPRYILIRDLGMIDTRWAMVLPGAMSVFNMIIVRTYYSSNVIPEDLFESARIDGSSDIYAFIKIALPLSAPIIAVIGLYYAVEHWNAFFGALIFLSDRALFPLQLVLRNILLLNQEINIDLADVGELEAMAKKLWMAESMKYALIFIASAPVLMAYPFIQRYFVKGVMIGSIKG